MRSAMHTASQLPGRGPTDVALKWMMHLHVNQKSDYDMMIPMWYPGSGVVLCFNDS